MRWFASCLKRLGSWMRSYGADRHGAAAAEFALVLAFLLIPLLNVIDFGIYLYQAMELDDAAQAAAEAALVTCSDINKLPATVNANCPGLSTAVSTAAQSTSLGSAVKITSTTENFYCVNSAGLLVTVGIFPNSEPVDCASAPGSATDSPGDYVLITASFKYSPLFSGVSLTSLLTTPITKTAWMRLA